MGFRAVYDASPLMGSAALGLQDPTENNYCRCRVPWYRHHIIHFFGGSKHENSGKSPGFSQSSNNKVQEFKHVCLSICLSVYLSLSVSTVYLSATTKFRKWDQARSQEM